MSARLRKRAWLAALALAPALAIACGAGAAPETSAPENTVTIDNFAFTPATLSVAAGATVTWTNRDDIPHTVVDTAAPRAFKSAPLDTGDHFSYRFDKPGTYAYFCSIHPHMTGRILVRGAK